MEATIKHTIQKILETTGIPFSKIVQTEVAGQTIYSIEVEDARQLIGAHGDTVYAIDMLVKKIVEKQLPQGTPMTEASPPQLYLIDVNDYRTKQIKDLQTKALMMAERARSFQYDVELSPMSAYERLIIHTTLTDAENIKTESQGEGRSRRVVIKYSV